MKKILYLLFFSGALLLAAWLFAPVSRIYDLFSDRLYPLQANQLEGSLYRGRAGELKWANVEVGQLQWDKQWPLARGGIQGNYRLRNDSLDLTGQLKLDKAHGLRASQLHGTLGWRDVESFLQWPRGRLQAKPVVNLDKLHYGPTGMKAVSGRIGLKDIHLVSPIQKALGDIWVDITTERNAMALGKVSSDSRVLNASGILYLHPHRFELNLLLKPKPGEYELQMALQNIGQPTSGGGRKIYIAGFY